MAQSKNLNIFKNRFKVAWLKTLIILLFALLAELRSCAAAVHRLGSGTFQTTAHEENN